MLKNPRLFLLPCNFVCNIAPYLRCQGDIITQSPGIFYHTFRVIIQQRSVSFNIWVMMIQFISTGPSAICRSERFESHWDTSFLCVTRKDMRWSSEATLGKIRVLWALSAADWSNAWHSCLCPPLFQCSTWHSLEQYHLTLHSPHRIFAFLDCSHSGVMPRAGSEGPVGEFFGAYVV